MERAKAFVGQNLAVLSQDAPADEKQVVFADWQASCLNKHSPDRIRAAQVANKIVNVLIDRLIFR